MWVKNNKLTVTEVSLNHENHALDDVTYNHYPENMRVPEDELKSVERMIALGVNKHKLKVDLMKDGKTIIALKTFHNIQTKLRVEKEGINANDILEKLLERLKEIPNARIRVVTNHDSELIGNYHLCFSSYFFCFLPICSLFHLFHRNIFPRG